MKRIIILLCAVVLMFAACVAQPAAETTAETTTVTTKTEITTTEATTTTQTTATTTTTAQRPTTTKPFTQTSATSEPTIEIWETLPPWFSGYEGRPTDEYGRPLTTTAKPAIYLYPRQAMQVDVTLTLRSGYFTQTIPAYGNGWHVLAQPDGKLTNLTDGKPYPYLFWEAMERAPWPEATEGFLVARDDLEGFFREKLAFIGLIPAEYEEFIDFWLPVLSQNVYNLIYFAGEEYTSRYPLEINPAPDSLLRVFMVARAATDNENVPQQKLKPFERKGFAVIEWGGTAL